MEIATAVSFASGFLKSYANSNQLAAEEANYKQQAEIFRRNARLIRKVGAFNEDNYRRQQRANMASVSAALGEAGMDSSPTSGAVLMTSYNAMEQNILNARFEVESEAENYLYQANVADENAHQAKKANKNKFSKALINGATSAITSLGF